MSSLNQVRAELKDAQKAKSYLKAKLNTTESGEKWKYWRKRLDEQQERIDLLTERLVALNVLRCSHE